MGWAKTDEDIKDTIDNRVRDSGHSYHGNTYINYYPDYLSKKQYAYRQQPKAVNEKYRLQKP